MMAGGSARANGGRCSLTRRRIAQPFWFSSSWLLDGLRSETVPARRRRGESGLDQGLAPPRAARVEAHVGGRLGLTFVEAVPSVD
ncbi:hypothetical protein WMF38_21135 [Sorangium sp. So ce118]